MSKKIETDCLRTGAESVVGEVEAVLTHVGDVSLVVTKHGSEAVHSVARVVLDVKGVSPEGMPAAETVNDGLAGGEAVSAALETTLQNISSSAIGAKVSEVAADEVIEELAEAMMDAVPVLGECRSAFKLLRGALTATVGVGALVVAASIATTGCVFTLSERTKRAGRTTALWGASVAGEGTFMAARGATNMVNVVPGTQFVTIPVSVFLGRASTRCVTLRSA